MPRILIVEDDAAIGVALEDDLRLEGYDVELVRDGETALQRARETSFDLVVLDVMLPNKDGFDVCRELRRSADIDARILMLTARTGETDKVLGLDLGADDYVTKPYSPKELRARVRALLRRTSDDRAEAITRFGDCELDLARGELRRSGKAVPTTPLELKLLDLFTRRAGRVLTRRILIDNAWGRDTAITERVVDNQIANLRRKIEPSPAAPRFLKSVRGIGYRFDLEDVTES
jgi:DNA-binding response OmpR family regulator